MKNCVLTIVISFLIAGAWAQSPQTWPVNLVDKPLHIGDNVNKEMNHPRPDAKKFSAKFVLPDHVQPTVATTVIVTMEIGGLVQNTKRTQPAGLKNTKLLINGTEIAVLNKLVRGEESPRNVQKIIVRVPGTALRPGSNDLEIVPGASAKTLDDFELHRVVVGSSAQ